MTEHSKVNARPRIDLKQARWSRVGIPLFVTYFVCYMDRTNISVAAPHMADELQISSAAMGLVFSAFFWGYVISGMPAGAWANRGHAKSIIVVCMVVIGLSAGVTGLVHDYVILLVARIALGLAEGMIFPAFAVMFISWYPSSERGLAVGLTNYTVPLSTVVMAPMSGWLIEATNWRAMFVIQAVPAFAVAAWLHFSISENPEGDKKISDDERAYIIQNRNVHTADESSLLQLFKRPTVWILGSVYFFWVMGIYTLTLWLPTVIGEMTGRGSLVVGLLTAIPFIIGTVAMYLATKAAVSAGRSLGVWIAPSIGLSGVAIMIHHFVHVGGVFSFLMLVLSAGAIYATLALWWTWVMQIVPRNQTGASVGFINLCGNMGGLVGPLLIGVFAVSGNVSSGFWIVGVGILIAALTVMTIDAHRTRSERRETQPESRPTYQESQSAVE
ncbi:MFS transporter [Nocardia carnea]|uniref:MFS transporter n=1 Tax=Nocardia carnea TaxID=37328 RepID=UPI002455F75C|nr:MFS transporter [Nocardia carnea]